MSDKFNVQHGEAPDDGWLSLPKDIPVSYDMANWVFSKLDQDGITVNPRDMFRFNRSRRSPWPQTEAYVTRCEIHGDPFIKGRDDSNTYNKRPYLPGPPLDASTISDTKPTWRGGSGPGSNFLGSCGAEDYIVGQGIVF